MVTGFMHHQAEYIKEKIGKIANVPEEVEEVFSNLRDPFEGLSTEYLQTKYIRENFRLLVSQF